MPAAQRSLTRYPNSIANLRFITSQSQSKKYASKLYRKGNEKEKEGFSCPVKSLLLSKHIGVTNICDLRLQHQAENDVLIWGSEFGTL